MSLSSAARSANAVRGTFRGSNMTTKPASRAAAARNRVPGTARSKKNASKSSMFLDCNSTFRRETTDCFGSLVPQAGHLWVNRCAPSGVPRMSSTIPGVRNAGTHSTVSVLIPAPVRSARRRLPRRSSPIRPRRVTSSPNSDPKNETLPQVPPIECQWSRIARSLTIISKVRYPAVSNRGRRLLICVIRFACQPDFKQFVDVLIALGSSPAVSSRLYMDYSQFVLESGQ